MANPSEASVQAQIGRLVEYLHQTYLYGGTNATNLIGLYDAIITGLDGDYSDPIADNVGVFRQQFSDLLDLGRTFLDPAWLTYAKALDFAEDNAEDILDRLFLDFTANSKSVQTRGLTLGDPVASGTPTGNGKILRLKQDINSQNIENQYADSKSAVCTTDANQGANAGEEVFDFRGGNESRDNLKRTGSGAIASIAAINARSSETYIGNPSFAQFQGTPTTPTEITSWTPSSPPDFSNFEIEQTTFYRTYQGEGVTPSSVRFKDNDSLEQLFSLRGATFSNEPYYLQVAFQREAGCDGTLTITLGGVTANVVLAAQTGWNLLSIPVGKDNWFESWNKQDAGVKIELSGRTTGTLLVDDVVLAPFTLFDGDYYAVVGGDVPFLQLDTFTWGDSEVGAKIQFWIWFLYSRYLPHSGTPTWSDP